MKKFISLLVAVLCLTTANACMKKNVPVRESPLTNNYAESTATRILDLVENAASRKSRSENRRI